MRMPPNIDRDKQVVELYTTGFTLERIGKMFGVTRERIRQIVQRDGHRPEGYITPTEWAKGHGYSESGANSIIYTRGEIPGIKWGGRILVKADGHRKGCIVCGIILQHSDYKYCEDCLKLALLESQCRCARRRQGIKKRRLIGQLLLPLQQLSEEQLVAILRRRKDGGKA